MSSFKLLKEKRFGPFYWTQFWGAFNDNFYKNALTIMIAYRATDEAQSGLLINIAAGLFILPFLLFGPLAGQIADKFDKSKIIRFVKKAEIIIMIIGTYGFVSDNKPVLLFGLFLMGIHSAVFGPIKYSILPLVLKREELVGGNALVESGTFLAILLGTLAGGLIVSVGTWEISASLISVAIIGYVYSLRIPSLKPASPDLKIKLNPATELKEMYAISKEEKSVRLSILGASWFWFFGATFLTQIPNFTKYFVGGNETIGTMFLAVFSISIGVGSLLTEKLSRGDIEMGLIPLGAFGMSLFAFDLSLINYQPATELISFGQFIENISFEKMRIVFDLAMLGIFGSFYTVPLYALIQQRTRPSVRSRLIAWFNIVNSVFIILSAVLSIALYKSGLNTVQIFAVVAVLNLLIATYIFFLIPEFLFRFFLWILANTVYRVRITGRDHIPVRGAALIVSNHVSFIDWFIVTAACRRPVRFVMWYKFLKFQ